MAMKQRASSTTRQQGQYNNIYIYMWQGPFGNISLRMKSTGTFLTSAHRSHLPMPPRTGEGETGRRGSLDRFLIVFHCSIIAHVYWEACVATNESAKASSTDLWPV